MGGKEFKKEQKKEDERTLPYSTRFQQIEKELNILQEKIITSKFFNDNKIKHYEFPTQEEISQVTKRNIDRAKEVGIKNPYIIFPHYLCQRLCETKIITKIDIFKTIKEVINSLTLTEEEKQSLNLIEERFEKEFDQSLKFVKYNLSSEEYMNLENLHFLGIDSNLLFNKKMNLQPEVFTLVLDDNLLDRYDHVRGIADVIANCPTLQIVNYILYPKNKDGKLADEFCLDGENYQSLFALIKAVTVNRNIKSFVLHSVEYYNLNLAPEICRLIEQKLQSETLVAFHLGNFNLKENWMKKIQFLLGATKSLLFLSYENKNYTKEDVLDFNKALIKNRSIMILSIVTPIFKKKKKKVVSDIKNNLKPNNKDSKLQIIYLSHRSLINPTWIAPNSTSK